ncbi:11043_t:CDS:2 [Funneliformis mosseae]|uniref:11043_t:CDS:1 n=1 Tax=Funneliformis mosseae TaxID=27381 RepID=A0A9N9H0L9_FUNMO|nr:11043_t:CDS:2 [Funneliformis mosseae]
MTELSKSNTFKSSLAEKAYTIEEEPRESVFMPLNKVKCVKKRSGNKKELENFVKLFKSDMSKMFDIFDPNFSGSLINASLEK